MKERLICPFLSTSDKCVVCTDGYLGISESLREVLINEYGGQFGKQQEIELMLSIAEKAMPTERCRAWKISEHGFGYCARLSK